jgi:hypothetical protein
MEVRRLPESELTHHGEKGQKWGVMHGPPYPLDDNASVQARRKKKSLLTKIKDKRKGKQLQKAKAAKKAEREKRESIINSGDAQKIKKISSSLSEEEMLRALTKIEFNAKLDSYKTGKQKEQADRARSWLQTTATTMQTVSSIAQSAGNVYTNLSNMGIINKPSQEDKEFAKLKRSADITKLMADIHENSKKMKGPSQADKDLEKLRRDADVAKYTTEKLGNEVKKDILESGDKDAIYRLLKIKKEDNN